MSAVGNNATADQKKLIDAAIEAGVQRFFPAEYGYDTRNKTALELMPLFNMKKEIVEYLKSKKDQISWTGVLTGPFVDFFLQLGMFGFHIPSSSATLYTPDYHSTTFSGTTMSTIGLAVARSLSPKYASETKNRYIYIRSVTTSQDEILANLEKVTGKEWSKNHVDLDPAFADAGAKASKGDMSGIALVLMGLLLNKNTGMNWDNRDVLADAVLDLPKENLDDIVKKILEANSQ